MRYTNRRIIIIILYVDFAYCAVINNFLQDSVRQPLI